MAVSKHNLWKRKKNGLMKLVRSHSDWLKKQIETKTRKMVEKAGLRNIKKIAKKPQWWDKSDSAGKSKDVASSTKRTQVGKKI